MKVHIGIDAQSGLAHTLVTIAANTSDIRQTHALLHGQGRTVFGDAGYQGVEKRPENQGKTVEWLVAVKRSGSRCLVSPIWCSPTGGRQRFMAEVRPEGGSSG